MFNPLDQPREPKALDLYIGLRYKAVKSHHQCPWNKWNDSGVLPCFCQV